MENNPIGVFDSGLGGLTAVKQLHNIMPNEDIVYFGDTERVPYGTRSDKTIVKYLSQDINFLKTKNVKFIIAACGTVSCILFKNNIQPNGLFTGVLAPACLAAAKANKNKKIGVIGTSATINSNAYKNTLANINPDLKVYQMACPLFVPLVENGFVDKKNEITNLVIKHYLEPLKQKGIDTLILGCTHYPIIEENIKKFMGESINLIDPGKKTANYVKGELLKNNLINKQNKSGKIEFFVSDEITDFKKNAQRFLNDKKIIDSNITKINIENF